MSRSPREIWPLSTAGQWTLPRLRPYVRCTCVAVLLVLTASGCTSITAREAYLRNAIDDQRERVEAGHRLSEASAAVLARNGLFSGIIASPDELARTLESRLRSKVEPDGALALAELSYQAGLAQASGRSAMPWYRDAAELAMMALDDPSGTRPDLAIEIHNHALERVIRIARNEGIAHKESWRNILGQLNIAVGTSSSFLDPQRLAGLQVAADLRVRGMDNIYRSSGVGVPLIAHRVVNPQATQEPRDQFMPREIRTGATAVLMPGGSLLEGEWRRSPASLVLFDPFRERSLNVASREITLASDRTTPLAVQVDRGHLAALEWTGLLDSSFERPGVETGLYTLRPYERGKIPVVFVHGLSSSPRAFVQTINELSNKPGIATRYQFWVFLYPTGLPIPSSASKLREAVIRTRETLDPEHADLALDRMVFVGHSMGGLLSKMMAQDSQQVLWNATIQQPYERILNSPTLMKTVGAALVYQPVPSVRRLVFIATPHRGSPIANELFGRVVASLVRRPTGEPGVAEELRAIYGKDVITRELRGKALNAIGNLRTDSPILAALDQIPINAGVPYHSIIPLINGNTNTDGVVEYSSSHLEGAVSEKTLPGTHFSQEKPEVTAELHRILLEHLEANRDVAVPAEAIQVAPEPPLTTNVSPPEPIQRTSATSAGPWKPVLGAQEPVEFRLQDQQPSLESPGS